jgi:hypothetical protein
MIAEAVQAAKRDDSARAIELLGRAIDAGATPAEVKGAETQVGKVLMAHLARAKKKKDHNGESEAKLEATKLRALARRHKR